MNNDQKPKKLDKKKIGIILLIILLVVLFILICLEIAVISDYYIYKDTPYDGLLLTFAQRQNGVFGIWK
ncbi:hypothetical protein V2E24_02205 [Mycoplasmopsis ciconiae]|uniref:Uncharacterized protein n=1 Tax=Mycoplasmopsis ciconiae TaxID=561067 RepID=A0ABU7MMU5_9BACT|nr:hypothetical protein [Mycoplasmopsis ciconiae]